MDAAGSRSSKLLCAGMNSNRATTRTFCLPSHGDENIPVGENAAKGL